MADPSTPIDAVTSRWQLTSTIPNKPTVTMAVMQDLEYDEQYLLWSCDADSAPEAKTTR
jgi:hypothetical protein